jgi:5-methylthioadenosine/S-adenosylhomocysteine deaminase
VLPLHDDSTQYESGVVVFEDGVLTYVGAADTAPPPAPDARIHDCAGCIIMPGLVNAHTHTGMTYLRNLLEDMPSADWFQREQHAERYMTRDDVYWSALLGAYEMLRQGITTCADRFSHGDKLIQALSHAGIRAIVAPSLVDRDAEIRKQQIIDLIERYGVNGDGLIHVGFGPVGPDTCSAELLQWTRALADKYGALIFIHVAQSRQELDVVASRGYGGSVRYLDSLGVLGPDVVAAHCMYVDDGEIELLAKHGVKIAHCPASNAKIEGVIAPILMLEYLGATIGLATDCAACNNGMDMFDEMKTAALMHKVASADPTVAPINKILGWATRGAAACIGMADKVGTLEVGKRADVITVRRDVAWLQPWHDIRAGLVYATRGLDVRDVWVNGLPRVRDGELLAVDAADAVERARAWVRLHAADLRN